MKIDFIRLTSLAKDNNNYRKVVETTPYVQTVVMNLIENEDIPSEIHEDNTQIIYVVDGLARILTPIERIYLSEGQMYVIPPNTQHYVANASINPLKLISVYLPAEHPADRVDRRQPN